MDKPCASNRSAVALLESLMKPTFWGNVTFILQHGQIIRAVKEESVVFNQPEPANRENDNAIISKS